MELPDRRDERGGGRIRLTLLGRIDLSDSSGRRNQSVLSQPKRVALLAYLAVEGRNRLVRRDELTGVFWPRRSDRRGRKALRDALYFLRRSLGDDVIVTPGDEVGLDWDRIECDAAESAGMSSTARSCRRARSRITASFSVASTFPTRRSSRSGLRGSERGSGARPALGNPKRQGRRHQRTSVELPRAGEHLRRAQARSGSGSRESQPWSR